jgi:hypothetical protein
VQESEDVFLTPFFSHPLNLGIDSQNEFDLESGGHNFHSSLGSPTHLGTYEMKAKTVNISSEKLTEHYCPKASIHEIATKRLCHAASSRESKPSCLGSGHTKEH